VFTIPYRESVPYTVTPGFKQFSQTFNFLWPTHLSLFIFVFIFILLVYVPHVHGYDMYSMFMM